MYYNLIKNYILKMSKNDIKDYAYKEGIILNENELEIIYNTIKNKWELLYYNKPNNIFEELKSNIRNEVYQKIINIYNNYKDHI